MNATDSENKPKRKRGRPKKILGESGKFSAHLEKIENAKTCALDFLGETQSGMKTPAAVLDIAWEIVFDFFMRAKSESVDVSELNTLAGIVQKLVSSKKSLAETKEPEVRKAHTGHLSEESVREIERRLKLL